MELCHVDAQGVRAKMWQLLSRFACDLIIICLYLIPSQISPELCYHYSSTNK